MMSYFQDKEYIDEIKLEYEDMVKRISYKNKSKKLISSYKII